MKHLYQTLQEMYELNCDFKEYVDRYSKCRHIEVEEALTHMIVKLKAQDIVERM